MPLGEVVDLAEIGQAIRARERMETIMDASAAAGTMTRTDQKAHIRDIAKLARGTPKPPAEPPQVQSREKTAADLAAFGVELVRAP